MTSVDNYLSSDFCVIYTKLNVNIYITCFYLYVLAYLPSLLCKPAGIEASAAQTAASRPPESR
jgi:hypothetical protein